MKKESAGKLKAQRYTIKLAKVAEKSRSKERRPDRRDDAEILRQRDRRLLHRQ